ncbi:MAG: hypothetical protein K9J27_09120 [Bacteroidales bacterium]|nr:hypothetical protein [Bacteroidales bacterium]MCF8334192.1 hypothetical protein [Bacteroidales bacterium]
MHIKILLLCLIISLNGSLNGQENQQKDFLVFHNNLMKPDTMRFAFWRQGDTLKVRRIIHQHVPIEGRGDKLDFSYKRENNKNLVEGARVFNGKRLQYRYGTEAYLLQNDTLYKFVQTNRLSRDSLDALFGHGKERRNYSKRNYRRNLQIIKDNNIRIKKVIFHRGMFEKGENPYLNKGDDCADTLILRNRWKKGGKTYYAITARFNCLKYPKKEHYIVDNQMNLRAFDKKYIDKALTPFLKIKPFKGRYFLEP